MNPNEYQRGTRDTAIYPVRQNDERVVALMYCALGLAGETGEVVEIIKKCHRDGIPLDLCKKLTNEIGDVLYYAARICDEVGIDLENVMEHNRSKLFSRKMRNALQGSGDDR